MRHNLLITWMDGSQESYKAEEVWVKDGVLTMTEPGSFATRGNTRNFPLANIRTYNIERV